MSVQPADYPRRSLIYRLLLGAGARFVPSEETGAALVADFGGAHESALAQRMGLADLSPLARTGFKGRDAPGWLEQQGVVLPEAPNRARTQDDGAQVLRLSREEHLILGPLAGTSGLVARLDAAWRIDPERLCYRLPRMESHCWLLVCGEQAPAMLAKLCGVDLRPHRFAVHAIAQTSLARINAIVARADLGATPAYHLLADAACGDYLWPCLLDAMQEFDGGPVGITALRDLPA